MADSSKITDKAAQLAGQAAAAAGPLAAQAKEKAGQLAGQAAAAAGPLAAQAKEKAGQLAEKSKPIAAHGVESIAGNIDKVTGRKYSDKITAMSSKLGAHLGPAKPAGAASEAPAGPSDPSATGPSDPSAAEPPAEGAGPSD